MDSCWILGAGRFGRRALSVLGRKYPEAAITVVDRDGDPVGEAPAGGRISAVRAEAVTYLVEHLKPGQSAPEWIVPAVPVHVAYEWVTRRLAAEGFRPTPLAVPETVVQSLPNVFRGTGGAIYASNADFICPDNCPEPDAICTHTGKPRPCNLSLIWAWTICTLIRNRDRLTVHLPTRLSAAFFQSWKPPGTGM